MKPLLALLLALFSQVPAGTAPAAAPTVPTPTGTPPRTLSVQGKARPPVEAPHVPLFMPDQPQLGTPPYVTVVPPEGNGDPGSSTWLIPTEFPKPAAQFIPTDARPVTILTTQPKRNASPTYTLSPAAPIVTTPANR